MISCKNSYVNRSKLFAITRYSAVECHEHRTHTHTSTMKIRNKKSKKKTNWNETRRDKRVSKWKRIKKRIMAKEDGKNDQTKTIWQIKRMESKRNESNRIECYSFKTKTVWLNGHETIALANTHQPMHASPTLCAKFSRIFHILIQRNENGTVGTRKRATRASVSQAMPSKI